MSRHEIIKYGFVIVDNSLMTNPYSYEQTIMDIFNISAKTRLKSDYISVLAKQRRGC